LGILSNGCRASLLVGKLQQNDKARTTNDEEVRMLKLTKGATKAGFVIRIFAIHSCLDIRASSFSIGIARCKKIISATITDRRYKNIK
jgi:hypothetical protein